MRANKNDRISKISNTKMNNKTKMKKEQKGWLYDTIQNNDKIRMDKIKWKKIRTNWYRGQWKKISIMPKIMAYIGKLKKGKFYNCPDFLIFQIQTTEFLHYSVFNFYSYFLPLNPCLTVLIISSSGFCSCTFPHLILSILIRWSGLYAYIAEKTTKFCKKKQKTCHWKNGKRKFQ